MSEMVERVARAIDEAVAKWQPGTQQSIKEMASRAAIESMREPTVAMIEAEPDGDGEFDKTNSAAHAKAFWQAMIDEALK